MIDPVWEQLHSTRPWGKYPEVDLVRTLMRAFPDAVQRNKTKVLEIGCGAGANLSFLVQEGFQVYGLDGAPSAIKNATERLEGLAKKDQIFELVVGDFSALSYAENMFDLVVDSKALYANNMDIITRTLAEVQRVLKPGGYFYSSVFGANTEGADSGVMLEKNTSKNPTKGPCKDMGTSHFFTEAELWELYTNWQEMRLRRITSETLGEPENIIEEWVVWART